MVPDAGGIFLYLGVVLLFNAPDTAARARARPDMFCTFQDKRYGPGESWHPYLEPHGLMYCIQCTCSEMGAVSCYKIKCPTLHCANPVAEPHQCCPRCSVTEPHTPSGLRAPMKSCQYNGTIYQHGEMFAADEPFPSRQLNQCVQCSCSEGNIYCGLKTCPELACSSPAVVPDSCCKVCKDEEKSAEEEQLQLNRSVRHSQDQCPGVSMSKRLVQATPPALKSTSIGLHPRSFKQKGGGTTVKIVLKEKHRKACTYNGKTYSHGEVWHPVVRSFGAMPCILCTCKDGSQDCKRVVCPAEYPCNFPEKVEGKCCKICQEIKVKPTEENNQVKCIKSPRNILVYMYMPPHSRIPKENLRIMAIEKDGSEAVEMYIWKMVNGIFHLVQVKTLGKQQFQRQEQNFRLVTRTNEGLWKFFRSPEEKIELTESEENEVKEL